jgi:hypothetical protein
MTFLLLALACEPAGPPGPPIPAVADVKVPVEDRATVGIGPGIAVILLPDGVWVDPSAWYAGLKGGPPKDRRPAVKIVALDQWTRSETHELAWPELANELAALRDQAPEQVGSVLLYAPADAPFEAARRVIWSASMAQVRGVSLVVAHADGKRAVIPQIFPRACGPGDGRECLFTRAEQVDGGWWVIADRSQTRSERCNPGILPPLEDGPAWIGHALVAAPGSCPSVTTLPALGAMVAEAGAKLGSPCLFGEVVPDRRSAYGDALEALLAVRYEGHVSSATFGVGSGQPPPACEAGFPIGSAPDRQDQLVHPSE